MLWWNINKGKVMGQESIMIRTHLSWNPKDICSLLWGIETGRKGVSYLSVLKKRRWSKFLSFGKNVRVQETSFPFTPGFFFPISLDLTMKPMASQGYICPIGGGDQKLVSTISHAWGHLHASSVPLCTLLCPTEPTRRFWHGTELCINQINPKNTLNSRMIIGSVLFTAYIVLSCVVQYVWITRGFAMSPNNIPAKEGRGGRKL